MSDQPPDKNFYLIHGGDHGRDIQIFAQSVYNDATLTIDRITPGLFEGMLDNVIDGIRHDTVKASSEIVHGHDADLLRYYGEGFIRELLSRFRLDKESRNESYSDEEMHKDHELLEGMLEDIIQKRHIYELSEE